MTEKGLNEHSARVRSVTPGEAGDEVEMWISRDGAGEMYSGAFWNDEEKERAKQWWITNDDHRSLTDHLEMLGALEEFDVAIATLLELGQLRGRVLDAGAGTCWSSALWSRQPDIEGVDAVEFSWHRISMLAGPTIAAMGGNAQKITRIFGSFLDIQRPAGNYDIVTMSAAFHHCSAPDELVVELDRCLAPRGVIVLLGEEPVKWSSILRRFSSNLIMRQRIALSFQSLFPPHPQIGDHYYRPSHYSRIFGRAGYMVRMVPVGRKNWVILAARTGENIL